MPHSLSSLGGIACRPLYCSVSGLHEDTREGKKADFQQFCIALYLRPVLIRSD